MLSLPIGAVPATESELARKRRGRPIDGILVLDKPAGMSSNGALQQVKRLYFAAKAGHTGSLDPMATGVLPICFGEATKFSQYLLDADKVYLSGFQLGVTTTTGDAEGEELVRRDASGVSRQQVLDALAGFRGVIEQLPPMYSAIKHQGQPLYKLARQGLEVVRKPRQVTIHQLALEDFQPSVSGPLLTVRVHCSKGTYIRTLAEDIGELLGCGAHVASLRRLQAGPFSLDTAVSIAELEALKDDQRVADMDKRLLPADAALGHLPAVRVSGATRHYLLQGQPVLIPHAPSGGMVRLVDDNEVFLGVGEVLDDGRIGPRRLVQTQSAPTPDE